MNRKQSMQRFGLQPSASDLDEIREILANEIEKESRQQGLGDTELIKLSCIQLFSAAQLRDVFLIWQAKTASMDSDGSVDIQLLCGAGLEETKRFLQKLDDDWAHAAMARIEQCEKFGDFDGFDITDQMSFYRDYYSEEPE